MTHSDDHALPPHDLDSPARVRTVWDAGAECTWRVWAADCRDVPGARGRECLIFDSGSTVRRSWSPPADWRSLSDRALLALLDARAER